MKMIELLRRLPLPILVILMTSAATAGATASGPVFTEASARWRLDHGLWRVHRVVDGDTIVVQRVGGRAMHTVRLLGMDTPEIRKPGVRMECGGLQATARMLALTFSRPGDGNDDGVVDRAGGRGAIVRLATDPSQPVYDIYNRTLAYVDLTADVPSAAPHDDRDLGRIMISEGLAVVYDTYSDFARQPSYEAASDAARAANRGSWARCGRDLNFEGG